MTRISEGTRQMIKINDRVIGIVADLRSLKRLLKTFPKKEKDFYQPKINRHLALLRKHTKSI